jgi:Na+/proline symporter
MIEKKSPPPVWAGVVIRGFFILAILLTALYGWTAATALSGFAAKFEIGVLCLFPAILGGAIWLAPRRGQMTEGLSVSLLCTLAFVIMYVGNVLARLTDYVHFAASMGKSIK